MLARIRKSMDEKDQGFTLIELLVVMIIIGILAAIAIPVFTSQRKKAVDTAAKSDVSILGKEIATHYVDQTAAPTVEIIGTAPNQKYKVNGLEMGRVSDNVTGVALGASPTATAWCVNVAVATDAGTQTAWKYTAGAGLASGAC